MQRHPPVINALKALGAKRVAVATPYHDELNEHEARFLMDNAIEVTTITGLGYGANGPDDYERIHRIPPEQVMDMALSADNSSADAVFLSCTDLPSFDQIEDIESRLSKPVITSNQATLWACLRAVGRRDKLPGLGMLFSALSEQF